MANARDYAVIDADGHITEPPEVWQEYAEPGYRARVIRLERGEKDRDEMWVEGKRRPHSNPAPASIPGGMRDRNRKLNWEDTLPGGYDPKRRLEILDAEGLDLALLFPTIYLIWGDIDDPQVAAATCRAYNDWMSDFCKTDPARLFGAGLVPLQDVELAAQECERIAERGLKAALIRPERFRRLALNDPACDPFWAAAQDCDLSVAVHGSFGSRMQSFGLQRYDNPFFTHMVCHPFEQMAACLDIVCGGVLERFPRLRVGFFESGLGWLAYWLDRMDEHFESMRPFVRDLERRPSDAFREQCFISMDADEGDALAAIAGRELSRCVLWGSDYPHYDCVYPGALKELEASCTDVTQGVMRSVLHDNPKRFMGIG